MLNEVLQQTVFGRRQVHVYTVLGDAVHLHIQFEAPENEPALSCQAANPPQRHPDARQQFLRVERFDKVIICAAVQGLDNIRLTAPGRKNNDGQF